MRVFYILPFMFFALHIGRAQDNALRVMSYNIRLPSQDDGVHHWDNRRNHVSGMIRFHEVDLLGVQEAFRKQLDELMQDLPEYEWFGVCRTDGSMEPVPDNEFSAIIYRKSRLERIEGNTFWLSPSPDIPGSRGWDAALPRIVTWARFRDKKNGTVFYHFNTHFDHAGDTARAESAKLLIETAAHIAGDYPLIITGDMNCTETELPYMRITNDTTLLPLADAMTICKKPHYGPHSTFAPGFAVSHLSDRRIDYIFVRNNMEVMQHAILSDFHNGAFHSDHLPVLARIIISQ